jgi:hypothetical protein
MTITGKRPTVRKEVPSPYNVFRVSDFVLSKTSFSASALYFVLVKTGGLESPLWENLSRLPCLDTRANLEIV